MTQYCWVNLKKIKLKLLLPTVVYRLGLFIISIRTISSINGARIEIVCSTVFGSMIIKLVRVIIRRLFSSIVHNHNRWAARLTRWSGRRRRGGREQRRHGLNYKRFHHVKHLLDIYIWSVLFLLLLLVFIH